MLTSVIGGLAGGGRPVYDGGMMLGRERLRWEIGVWVLAAGMVGGVAGEERNGDWPQFLGPHRNNTIEASGLTTKWGEGGPPVRWEREVGAGYGAPSVRGDVLVLHDRSGNEERVQAMDAGTGERLWQYEYPSRFRDPYGYNNGPRCSPLLTTNRCYTFGAEGKLLCLDLTTGAPVWQRDTAADWDVPEAFFGVGSSPILLDNRLIVVVGGQPNAAVVALDAATGETLWENGGQSAWDGVITTGWRREAPYEWTGYEKIAAYSSPVVATIHRQRHLLCFLRQGLVSLDPVNGSPRFAFWFQSPVDESVNAMVPVVNDDHIFLSAAYYRIGAVLLEVTSDGKSVETVWRHPPSPWARDADTGGLIDPVMEIHWSTPVLHQGYLYGFSGRNEPDATFRCVEFRTGKLRWSRDERWRRTSRNPQPNVYGRGSLILADEKLLVLGEGGKLGFFHPTPERPVEICSWQVPHLRFPCWTGPVLAHRNLYLRSEDRLVCLDLRE